MRTYIKKMELEGSSCVPVPEEILKEIEDADVLQVHMMPVPAEVFQCGNKLKILISNRGGVENIDVPAAARKGIPVINQIKERIVDYAFYGNRSWYAGSTSGSV
jgi:D-3-phosphoglycerate dehydrogenase / 2-oxoglutarate reductase